MAEYFDMMGNINSMNQGFNALGDLGRFLLQKRGQDMQQRLQDYQNREADRKRKLEENKLKQIGQIMLGAQTRPQTVSDPYTVTEEVDVTEPAGVVNAPDIAAYMQRPGAIYDRNAAGKQVPSMVDQGDFSGLAGQAPEQSYPDIAAYMQGVPGASPMEKTVESPKQVDPLELLRQMPISPVDAVRKIGTQKIERTETRERTENVPNENWMGDAARGVAAIDPELGMDMARTDAASRRSSSVYTPEQKQLVDAKQQNRINLDRATASLNSAMQRGDEEQIGYWDSQVKGLKANEQRMASQLAELGVGGYEVASAASPEAVTPVAIGGAVDLDKDVTRRREFMDGYKPKALAEVPTESDIMADAMEKGYKISRSGAAQIKAELASKVQAGYSDKDNRQREADAARRAGQEQYENWLKNTLPSVDKAYNGLLETRNGIASALEQANRSAAGGAYIAMKKVLGDALSNADFAGIAGFGVDAGLIGLLKAKLGATSMNDADAKAILEQAVSGFNTMLRDYEGRFSDSSNPGYVSKAKKAYGLKPLSYGKTSAPAAGAGKGKHGRVPVPIDDDADF